MRGTRRWTLLALTALVVVLASLLVWFSGDDGDDVATDDVTSTSSSAPDTSTSQRTSTSGSSSTTTSTTDASPRDPTTAAPPTTARPRDPFLDVRIRLTRVTSVSYPIAMAVRPSDDSIWLATKGGSVCRVSGGSCVGLQQIADVSTGSEQGLLGIAFDETGSRLFSSYTNPSGDSRVARHVMAGNAVGEGDEIFRQDQPYSNHNGGNIAFGPDGWLWLGLGDGGSGGDPQNHAQNLRSRLGKMLRIHPTTADVQVLIRGVRNPWRWSFDRANDALWMADVGQGQWEEINLLPAGHQSGVNLGWSRFEGTHVYNDDVAAPGARPPIYEYPHGPGCSVTGGYVYRGAAIPALRGAYLFSDYCDGTIRGLKAANGVVGAVRSFGVNPGSVVSFGEDVRGELYVLVAQGGVYRIVSA